jgi:hypothetical protein
MKKRYFYFFLTAVLLFFTTCAFAQSGEVTEEFIHDPFNGNKGKCFAKCLVPFENFEDGVLIPIYTGEDKDIQGIELILKEDKPSTTKWVKKNADLKCLSADPNDCLIWCSVSVPPYYQEIYMVQDTNLIKDFEMRPLAEYTSEEKQRIGWFELLCEEKLNERFYSALTVALKRKGYATKKENDKDYLKKELTRYQRNNNLPVGNLNVVTLEHLGLR